MPRLKGYTEAYSWLQKNVARKEAALQTLDAKEKQTLKREMDLWVGLKKKICDIPVQLDTDSSFTFILNRNELRALESLVLEQMVNVNSKALPAYRERASKNPAQASKLLPYMQKLEALYMGLSELMEEIQGALK